MSNNRALRNRLSSLTHRIAAAAFTASARVASCLSYINCNYANLLSALAAILILLVTCYYAQLTHRIVLSSADPDITIQPRLLKIQGDEFSFLVQNRGDVDVRNLEVHDVVYFATTNAIPVRVLQTETNIVNQPLLKAGEQISATAKLMFSRDPGTAKERALYAAGKGHIVFQFYIHYKHANTRRSSILTPRYFLVIDHLMRGDEGYEGFTRWLDPIYRGKLSR